MLHSVIVESKDKESVQEFLARIKREHPGPKQSEAELKVTSEMRREAFGRGIADRRKLGDDY